MAHSPSGVRTAKVTGGEGTLMGAHPALAASHAAARAAPHPAVGSPSISVAFGGSIPLFVHLPVTVTYNITITNETTPFDSATNSSVHFDVRDIPGASCGLLFFGPAPCPEVENISVPISSGQTAFSQTLNYSTLNASGYAGHSAGGLFPADEYQLLVWVTYNQSGVLTNGSGQHNAFLIFFSPGAKFLAPLAGSSLSTGNVTFAVEYYGYLINGAELTVADSSGKEVYVQGLFSGGLGNRSVGAATPWLAAQAGTYVATLNLSTPYGITLLTENLTIIPAGQTIYVNSSTTHTDNLPGGLGTGTFATLLLVIGLIVGLIVALVLGRLMWGGPMTPASPQPWSPTQGSGGSGGSTGGSSGGSGGSSDTSGGTNKP